MPEQMYNGMGEGGEGIELLQVQSEWEPIQALYLERKPRRVLEIGSWDGGTLRFWLENAAPNAVICAIDLEHRNRGWYDGWRKPDTTLWVAEYDSTSDEGMDWVYSHAPYDWALIDGDHSLAAARSDAALCLTCMNPGSVILFHDIEPSVFENECGPRAAMDEIVDWNGYKFERHIDPEPQEWSHGMGVVYL